MMMMMTTTMTNPVWCNVRILYTDSDLLYQTKQFVSP
jgi:hypothetical protein